MIAQEYSKIINKQITVYTSKQILGEISRVLTYPKIIQILNASESNAKQILRTIAANSTIVDPKIKLQVLNEDPGGNIILECAMAVGADFIITGDSRLLRIGKFKQTTIMSPRDFLDYCIS